MKLESELELQAYLDGELAPAQGRKVAASLAQDEEARLLFAELKMTKTALVGAEPELKVPESREFYWSKIQREIEHAEQPQPRMTPPFIVAWRRLVAPLAGVALITFLTVYSFRIYDGVDSSKRHLAVVENLSEHTGAYSFRSQAENMFVVWVYDRSDEANAESEPTDEQVDQ
jgi:hypothetical protein